MRRASEIDLAESIARPRTRDDLYAGPVGSLAQTAASRVAIIESARACGITRISNDGSRADLLGELD